MDWDNARIFLAIYRVGTLRGAAALLQIDQATAGRRLAALESSLDARLFLRTPGIRARRPASWHSRRPSAWSRRPISCSARCRAWTIGCRA